MTSRDILVRMREEIEERGWCKGRLSNDEGALCLVGAKNLAVRGDPWNYGTGFPATAEEHAVHVHLLDAIGLSCASVATFNDHPDTDESAVFNALDKAIEAAS